MPALALAALLSSASAGTHVPDRALVRAAVELAVDADGLPRDPDLRSLSEELGLRWSRVFPVGAGRADPDGFRALGLHRAWRVHVDDIVAPDLLARLTDEPLVQVATADPVGQGDWVPDDPEGVDQWAQFNDGTFDTAVHRADTRAVAAWELSRGSPSVVVAVLDSGLLYTDPDLQPAVWRNAAEVPNGLDDDGNGYVDDLIGWDFHYGDNDPWDGHGHGTHVAGTAAALGNNGLGHVGMCPDCTIMPLKNLDDSNRGAYSDWAESLVYAADHGATVVNMSEGGDGYHALLHDAVRYATGLGIPVITSAGNDDWGLAHYPSGHPESISVGATTQADMRVRSAMSTWGSNFGAGLDVVAPGWSIASFGTTPGWYGYHRGGTSMATPQVTGLAALMLHLDPALTPEEVRRFLQHGALDRVGGSVEDALGRDDFYGYGRIDARRTLELVRDHPAGPPPVHLSCRSPRSGAPLDCVVDGAAAGATVRFALGTGAGVGPCLPAGPCLGITGASLAATVVADASGVASASIPAPPWPLGASIAVQAAAGSLPSTVWTGSVEGCGDGVVQAPEDCDDGNADEVDGCTTACVATWPAHGDLGAGGHHTCVLDGGAARCFGRNGDGQSAPQPGPFLEVATGRFHTCARRTDGTLSCWGRNDDGQLAAPAGSFTALELGWYHGCALDAAGFPSCWGEDDHGQASPPALPLVAVDAGYDHTCGLLPAPVLRAVCWGDDALGQSSPPADELVDLATGSSHSCGIRSADGELACWGDNAWGQAAEPAGPWLDVAAGLAHTCAIDAAGAIACWGRDRRHVLDPPAGVFTEVKAGRYHTCALRADATWHCWGGNGEGALNVACGDGVVQGREACDDGARIAGDGCDPSCRIEP